MTKMNVHAGQALHDLQNTHRGRLMKLAEDANAGVFKDRVAAVTVEADPHDSAAVRARVIAATLHAVSSPVNGDPLTTTNAAVAELENLDSALEARIEDFYTGAGRRFLPLHLLYGADGDGAHSIRAIVSRAVGAYQATFRPGVDARIGDVVAIATSQPHLTWRITAARTIEVVTELIAQDVHCDLDIFKGTDHGSCVDRLGHVADLYGKTGQRERHRYIGENFATVPFRCGDLYVLARICNGCYETFLKQNNVKTKSIKIVEPWSDGFGSIATNS